MSGPGPQHTVLLHADAVSAAEDSGKAGPLGLLVLILLGLASYFLFRSMSRHLRRVRDDFPVAPAPGRPIEGRTAAGDPQATGAVESTPSAEPPRPAGPPPPP